MGGGASDTSSNYVKLLDTVPYEIADRYTNSGGIWGSSFAEYNGDIYTFGSNYPFHGYDQRPYKYDGSSWTLVQDQYVSLSGLCSLFVLNNILYAFVGDSITQYIPGQPLKFIYNYTYIAGSVNFILNNILYFFHISIYSNDSITTRTYEIFTINESNHTSTLVKYIRPDEISTNDSILIENVFSFNNKAYFTVNAYNNGVSTTLLYSTSDLNNYKLETTLPVWYNTSNICAVDDKLHVITGQSNLINYHWVYDGSSWKQLPSTPSLGFDYMALFSYQHKLHIIVTGYRTDPNSYAPMSSNFHYIYNDSDDSFTKVSWLCSK